MSNANAARDPKLYLQEITKYAQRIEKTISGLDYTAFSLDQDKIKSTF